MDAGDSSSGLNSIGQGGAIGNRVGDSQLVGVPGEAPDAVAVVQLGEQVALPATGMSSVATVATAGEVMEKRKRGRPSRGQAPKVAPPAKRIKEEEEDVCFICFDGGHLVLCDRKGCPKAYHATCIKRDESFFRSKSKWNCGWHICSVCLKAAHFMCYTCTYSLCKKCTKDADYVCVRGNNGFCATCMKTIMLIENEDAGNKEMIQVDFDDQSSWEYLFKVYWILLKNKLSLTVNELKQARNPGRVLVGTDIRPKPPEKFVEDGATPNLVKMSEYSELKIVKDQLQLPEQNSLSTDYPSCDKSTILDGSSDWASRELLEFVAHMKNGDTTVLTRFDVQALMLEYIKTNNLQDPRRKSQIICDVRLKNLFGKPRVGHVEMLKLLEYHFSKKGDTQKEAFIPAGTVGRLAKHASADLHDSPVLNQTKRRIARRTPQNNLDAYAAINLHNISLIFLRRSMLENLFGEVEKFHDKVVGSIVRIRVSSNDQKHEMYRLVQVVGTSKAAEPSKIGDKTADIMLEVLNLNKKETLSIDAISDQDFSEEECKRLCQSIKFGLVKQLTVGEIQKKAIELQDVKLDDGLTAEILRLNHLRDRASEKGHKKELRECIEKLQILKTPKQRHRRPCKIPEVHADPTMHPDYESGDDALHEGDKKQDEVSRLRYSSFNSSGNQLVHSKRGVKEDESAGAQQLQEQSNGGRSNVKQENHVVAGGSLSVCGNQAVPRSDSENATLIPTGESPSINSIEMENIWHYRDPSGKIQGPFAMAQLRKWSTTGYFPEDMRIWNDNEPDCSVLLNDALNGKFHNFSESLHCMSMQYREVGNAVDNTVHVHSGGTGSAATQDGVLQCTDSTVQMNSAHEFDRSEARNHNYVCQSSQQNPGPVPLNLDLNDKDSDIVSVTNPCKSSEQRGDSKLLDLPCPTPKTSTRNLEGKSFEHQESASLEVRPAEVQRLIDIHSKDTGISDLPSPRQNSMDVDLPRPSSDPTSPVCKTSDEGQGGQTAVTEQPVPSKIPFEDLGWNSASGQVAGGGHMQGTANDWVGCAPTGTAKPCSREWEPGKMSLSSLKLSEMIGNLGATPNSNQHPHSSPSHPAPNVSNWHAINEPIEFDTLAEESVSDLLAEYDAMESQSGLASPTSAARCVDDMMDRNDCFSSIEDLSPAPDVGKSDALSSTADIPFPSLAAVMDDLFGTPEADAFDPLKRSGGHSTTSSEGETKSADAIASCWEVGPDTHPPAPGSINQVMVSANMARGRGLETMDASWAAVQGNMNLGWAGPPQAFANIGWGSSVGTSWMDPNFNVGAYNSNMGWNSPRKYGGDRFAGSRDWPFQGGDLGFGRGRPMWGRQSHGGGGGGGYSRPSSKGQRVCKFYESGHCKKGASCDYLHP